MSLDPYGPGSNLSERFVTDHDKLKKMVEYSRDNHPSRKIVMTSGVYDLTHIGHLRYLEKAKALGGILIVSLDCDDAVKLRKEPDRPVVPEGERVETLVHSRHVDLITLDTDYQDDGHTKFSLVKLLRPDVFVASKRSFSKEQLAVIRQHAGKVVTLPSQAETSTSAQIRKLVIGPWREIGQELEGVEASVAAIREKVRIKGE